MIRDFKQFVPSSVCLKCDGCCRFKESDSRWRPSITSIEMKAAAALSFPKKALGSQSGSSREFGKHVVGSDGRINATPCGEGFLCHFLNAKNNTCGIYHARPFECQLYPFLLGKEQDKAVLYVHLNCPYVQEHWKDEVYKEYARYLQEFFRREDVIKFLNNNPSLLADYSEFRDELDIVCTLSLE